MTQLSRREVRHAQTKQEIINIAFELVIEKGADKLSLREVARQAGYKSPAGLYEYFDGKDGIIEAVCFEADHRFRSYLVNIDKSLPAGQYMVEIGMAYIRFARENPEQFLFLFDNQTVAADEADVMEVVSADTEDNAFSLVYHAIERCINEGVISQPEDMSVLDMTYCFWILSHGAATLQNRHLKAFPIDFKANDRKAIMALLAGFGLTDTD